MVSSFEEINFTMNRYTNENFTSASNSSDLVAGDKIYRSETKYVLSTDDGKLGSGGEIVLVYFGRTIS